MISTLYLAFVVVGSGLATALGNPGTSECGRPFVVESKAVRGAFAPFGELPWHVGIYGPALSQGIRLICEGVLIHERYVLTAAQCVFEFKGGLLPYKVRSGDFDLDGFPHEDYKVRRKIVHGNFTEAPDVGFLNDIALLELTEAVTFKKHIMAICLPARDAHFIGANVTTTGWGPLNETAVHEVPSLHKFAAQVVENESCGSQFNSNHNGSRDLSGLLCVSLRTKGTGPCRIGSPLIQEKEGRYQVIGIASGEIPEECLSSLRPSFYTNVTNFLDWVNANIQLERDLKEETEETEEPSWTKLEGTLRNVRAGIFACFALLLVLVAGLAITVVKLLHYTEVTEQLERDFYSTNGDLEVHFMRHGGLMSTMANFRNYGVGVAISSNTRKTHSSESLVPERPNTP